MNGLPRRLGLAKGIPFRRPEVPYSSRPESAIYGTAKYTLPSASRQSPSRYPGIGWGKDQAANETELWNLD
jgi:hypothetical protein